MKDKLFRRLIALVIALVMIVPTVAAVYADDTAASPSAKRETSAQSLDDENRARTYGTYYDKHENDPRPKQEIVIDGTSYSEASDVTGAYVGAGDGGVGDVLFWPEPSGKVSFDVDIPTAGVYSMKIEYYALSSSANNIEFGVQIDGEYPFDTAERISLAKLWVGAEDSFEHDDAGNRLGFRKDIHDNQIRPTLEEALGWQTAYLKDSDGLFIGPLGFYFSAGSHTISLVSEKARFAIKSITLCNPDEVPSLTQVSTITTDEATASASSNIFVSIEGETPASASDITLYPTYDRSTYLTSPSDPTKMTYNTIGKENWKTSGQYISWDFEMPEAGWVKIGIRAKQDQMRGLYSNRTLYIDGEVPCKEAEQIKFYYSTAWECVSPTDADGNVIYFYLEAGKHNLMLEAMPGEIGQIMRQLDDIVYYLNSYYRQILQITGPSPDEYNTYMIQNQIDGIIDDFAVYAELLRATKSQIETLAGTSGTEAVSLETMAKLLDRLVKRPDDIPGSLGQIKDNISSLSQWMADYRSQALEVDIIELVSADKDFSPVKENFFKQLSFSFRSFLGSFFEDYDVLSDENASALNVWVSLGRDQAQIVKELVDSYFANEERPININLVQGGILESTLAGKGPDVVLFVGGDLPIQLAARDCLLDISQFPDYQEVIQRFAPNVMTLYTYQGGVYGLPISQNFSMMFCRTDVLNSFGFDGGPQTWTELIDMLPTLQRSYMGVGFNFDVYGTFMVQRGLGYYNASKTKTIFETQPAVEAFETWTKFYSTYSFEQTFDQFTRFRSGEYPIVITGYTFYNQLYMAAPEIRGLWEFELIPASVDEKGNYNRSTTSSSAGAIIFSKLNQQQREVAWELIKWFTSAEIQSEYGRSIEALLGPLGRFDTANKEALGQLAWSQSELTLILEQMNSTVDIDIIPATYIVTRNITNAFRETVNLNTNPRDTLLWYNKDINDEIIRKYEELGIPIPEES